MTPSTEKSAQRSAVNSQHPFVWIVGAVSTIPLLLFLASQLGQFSFICELISNFQLFILLGLLPFPFLLFRLGSRRWASVLGLAVVWSLILVVSVYWPASSPKEGDTRIHVMSFNVLGNNPNHASVLKLIAESDPDVLMVLEYSRPWVNPLSILESDYPYRVEVPRWHGFGIALFSKYPIVDHQVVQLVAKRSDNPAIFANLDVDGVSIRVVGIHSVSPINRKRMEIRNQQFEEVTEHLAKSDEPTILLGDFNCTTWSPYLRKLMKRSKLSDSRRGFGYLATWNANRWPFQIPIDHALVSRHIHVHRRTKGDRSGGSDHFPIHCEISVAAQPK